MLTKLKRGFFQVTSIRFNMRLSGNIVHQQSFDFGINIRQAQKDDADICVDLIYSAGPEMYEYVFTDEGKQAHEFIRYEFINGSRFAGHLIHAVAELNGKVVGVASFYHGRQLWSLAKDAFISVLRFYGVRQAWGVFVRGNQLNSVVENPQRNEMYIANVGVKKEAWGRGIASALIK
ncbi:MAG: GNAT family N-acetyltransferase, partial [Deltaproteobacteria bacterium]